MTYSAAVSRSVSCAPSNFAHTRAGVKIDRFVLHHQAGYTPTTLAMMTTGSKRVSATYVVSSDGSAVGVVPEEDTPFTNDDLGWNRRSITFEIENSPGIGKPTTAAHDVVARILADAAHRYGIPIDRDHVLGHRELYTRYGVGYATACPGELDLDYIVKRALTFAGVKSPAKPPKPSKPAGLKAPAFPLPKGSYFGPKTGGPESVSGYYSHQADLKRWQGQMRARGWQIGVDGLYGPDTERNAREFQAEKHLTVDGRVGPQTWAAAWTAPIS